MYVCILVINVYRQVLMYVRTVLCVFMIVCMYAGPHFGGFLVDALQTVSKKFDGDRIVRFGWMRRADIVVISAVVRIYTYYLHTYIHNKCHIISMSG